MRPPRLAVLPDFKEELWPSMDLCADMLMHHLQAFERRVTATRVAPSYKRHFKYLPLASRVGTLRNADRLLNRMRTYPRFAASVSCRYDLYHVCDHSYSQLIHALPAGRCGVLCHDLDTFRCILEPAVESRPQWFMRMMRKALDGMKKAAVVFYTTAAVRSRIEEFKLVDPRKLVQVPLGVAEEFTEHGPTGEATTPYLLHVGSSIPRKRLDVLLDVFAGVNSQLSGLRLEQVGGEWTTGQRDQIKRLGVAGSIRQRRGLSRREIAALYRGAAAVLVTSEAEGFGLPVIEAMACGAAVVASDLPVLREVGGSGASYCPVADVPRWIETVLKRVREPAVAPDVPTRVAQAARYSWRMHADVISATYAGLAESGV